MTAQIETFGQLTDRVLNWMSDSGNTGLMRTLVQDAIKDSHARRLTAEPWVFMRWPRIETFDLVAGQRTYTLHELYLFPRYMLNRRTNRPLEEIVDRGLLEHIQGFDETGDADRFVYSGRTKVQRQPTTASVITATSSNPSDNGKMVTITGLTSAGSVVSETLTLPNAGSTQFVEVLDVLKVDPTWLGTLTIAAGATTLLQLGASEWGKSYQQFELLVTPTSADTIEYSFYRQPKTLSHNNDLLDIPPPFTHLCVYDALLDLQGYTRATEAEMKRWREKSAELELAMQQSFLEGHTLGAESAGITYIRR